MMRISFNPRFVNEAGNDLIPGKIHTIRQNYGWWKKHEGKEVELFTWEGKPYGKGNKQIVFCVKRIVSVQEIELFKQVTGTRNDQTIIRYFFFKGSGIFNAKLHKKLAFNDGFSCISDFLDWFEIYKPGKMAILHFTDFRY